jgi:hypothetical protein
MGLTVIPISAFSAMRRLLWNKENLKVRRPNRYKSVHDLVP